MNLCSVNCGDWVTPTFTDPTQAKSKENIEEIQIPDIDTTKLYLPECYHYSKRVYAVIRVLEYDALYAQGISVWYGINKIKSTSATSLRTIESVLSTEDAIGFFPAGLVSRKQDGVVKDLEWKPTFVKKAIRYQREVVPVYIDGGLSNFFYRLYSFRKFLGIKFNIEMLYLSNETFKQANKTINIKIGKPIPYSKFDSSKTAEQWAESLKEYVYSLREGPKDHFF